MNKFLYFASAAADGTAGDEEVAAFNADGVSHMEANSATTLTVYFQSGISQETNTGDGDIHVDHSKVILTITSAKHKEVIEAVAGACNATHNSGMVVVADVTNGVYCHPDITGVAITTIDAS